MFKKATSFAVAMVISASVFAGSYSFTNTQYGSTNSHSYWLKFYKGELVNGNFHYSLVFDEEYTLTHSIPEWGIYRYDAGFLLTPAGGNEFEDTLIEI
jgi:hypothetical protein